MEWGKGITIIDQTEETVAFARTKVLFVDEPSPIIPTSVNITTTSPSTTQSQLFELDDDENKNTNDQQQEDEVSLQKQLITIQTKLNKLKQQQNSGQLYELDDIPEMPSPSPSIVNLSYMTEFIQLVEADKSKSGLDKKMELLSCAQDYPKQLFALQQVEKYSVESEKVQHTRQVMCNYLNKKLTQANGLLSTFQAMLDDDEENSAALLGVEAQKQNIDKVSALLDNIQSDNK